MESKDADILIVDFRPMFRMQVAELISKIGHEDTFKALVDEGYSEAFARVLVRRILKERGW